MINPLADRQVRAGLSDLFGRVWRAAHLLCATPEQAEKVVEDTVRRVIRNAEDYATGSPLDRWVMKQVVHVWTASKAKDGVAPSPDTAAQATLVSVFHALPRNERSIAVLAYAEGLPHREVARLLSIPISAVMVRFATARTSLAPLVGVSLGPAQTEAINPDAPYSEAALTAYLDGTLAPRPRVLVDNRLRKEPDLDTHLRALDPLAVPLAEALAPLCDAVPVERLRQVLDDAIVAVEAERDEAAVGDTAITVARLKKLQRLVLFLAMVVVGIAIYAFFTWGPGNR